MNRINSIRNLALAIVLGGLAAMGCAGQTSDSTDSRESDLDRKAHFVGVGGSDDGPTSVVEHQLGVQQGLHFVKKGGDEGDPAKGPRPEPWMNPREFGEDKGGPRPEPWMDPADDSNGSTPPTGSSSGGNGTSGGNPNPTK